MVSLAFFVLGLCFSSYATENNSTCEAKNFDNFFNKYTESIEMQKLCIKLPLEKLELIEEQEDLMPRTQNLSLEQMTFPLIITQKTIKDQNLALKVLIINNKKARVELYKQDSGYKIIYRFKKYKNKKWKLIKIEDWSI
jgi:hypothetical protein